MKRLLTQCLLLNDLTPIQIQTEAGSGAISKTRATAEELGFKIIETR